MKVISYSIAPVFGAALFALLTFSQPALASFAVIINNPNFSISSTSIPTGGSVQITGGDSDPYSFSFSGDYMATYYPGDYAAQLSLLDQFNFTSSVSFSAPGSVEMSGGSSFFYYNLDGYFYNLNSGNTFTYNARGVYTIDYSYSYSMAALPLGTIYENPNINDINDQFVAGPFLQEIGGEISGTGSFTVNVGGVPEPSSWAMLLIGFVGIGFAACRRSASKRNNVFMAPLPRRLRAIQLWTQPAYPR
jgi:hypothetical protein